MLNIGVLGAGRIGKVRASYIRQYVNNANVTMIADSAMDDDKKNWALDEGISVIHEDYQKILMDDSIDAVMICTPTPTHSMIALDAINCGKHIFCEKPVDMDVDRICQVMDRLRGSGLVFQLGFMQRSDINFSRLKETVASGKIGKIHTVRIISRDPAPPPIEYVKTSGGIFLDMMIHDIDLLHFFTESEVKTVFAQGSCLVDPAIGEAGDADTAVASIQMTNGIIASIENSRLSPNGYDQRAEISGDAGMAAAGNLRDDTLTVQTKEGCFSGNAEGFFMERYKNAYISEMSAFANSIEYNMPVAVGIVDGLRNQKVGLALKQSFEKGIPITL
jgi:myo-inositol 2-dehydrogenase/D-chiro-inositol 1-dehydrogenase